MFTAITLLLAQLSDPNSLSSQLALFFLAAVFELTLFVAGWNAGTGIYICRNVPPTTKETLIINGLIYLIFGMIGAAVAVLFLLWNLIYLALASGTMWTLLIIVVFSIHMKPFLKWRKTVS